MATSWYIWSEPKCNKSSCKIATALQNYLTKENKESIEHLYSFSNTSGAQNNNHMVFQILLNIFHNFDVNSIILTYLVSGHSQNAHSTIEQMAKKKTIYSPAEWEVVIDCAFRKNVCTLEILEHEKKR